MDFITPLENYAPSPDFPSSSFSTSSVGAPFINTRTHNRNPSLTNRPRYRTFTNRYLNGVHSLCSPAFAGPQPIHVFGPPLSHGASQQYRLEHGDEDEEQRDFTLTDEDTVFAGNDSYDYDNDDDENPRPQNIEYADQFIYVDNELHNPNHPLYYCVARIARTDSPFSSSEDGESMFGSYGDSDDYHTYQDSDQDTDHDHVYVHDGEDDDDDDTPTSEHIEDVATLQ